MLVYLMTRVVVTASAISSLCMLAAQPTVIDTVDPMLLFEEAQEDHAGGRMEESLRKLEWLFRKGHEAEPGFDSVRVSFVIGAWADLSNDFPPARKRLMCLRNSVRKSLLSSTDESVEQHFREFDAIARALNASEDSVAVFRQLHSNRRTLAVKAIRVAKDALFEHKEYRLLSEYIDPAAEFKAETRRYKAVSTSKHVIEDARRVLQGQYQERTLGLVDMLVTLGLRDEAVEIARIAMEVAPGVKFENDVAESLGKEVEQK